MNNKVVLIGMLLFIFSSVFAQEKAYVLDIHYSDGKLELQNVYVDAVYPQNSEEQSEKTYKAVIKDFENKELYTHFFLINRFIMGPLPADENEEQQVVELNDLNFVLILPYFRNGKSIEVYDPEGNKLLDVDVAIFADTCGDNICQAHESYESCPKDCKSGNLDDYCDKVSDGKCDPDCSIEQDPDCKPPSKPSEEDLKSALEQGKVGEKTQALDWTLLGGIALVLAAIVAVVLFLRRTR